VSDFNLLLEKEIPRLRRYAWALLHDESRADDLVQDTLLRAVAKQHLWQAGTDLRAWLFTIMHNGHVNNVRRAVRDRAVVDVEDVASTLVAPSDPTASRQLHELDRAIARLPVVQRQAILLIGLEGMRYDEAAVVMGVPSGPCALAFPVDVSCSASCSRERNHINAHSRTVTSTLRISEPAECRLPKRKALAAAEQARG